MKRGGRAGDVLADDGGIANLPVADAKLVVCQPDRSRIVGPFRQAKSAAEKGDPSRRLPARNCDAAVHPPQVGKSCGVEAIAADRLGPKGIGRLVQVVLKKPGLRQCAPDLRFVVTVDVWSLERAGEKVHR